MYLKELSLVNYRNYKEETLCLSPNINLFFGKNAQGKTNLLEAIYVLSCGSSFRASKSEELILHHADFLRLRGVLMLEREYVIELYLDRNKKKQIKINGVKYQKNTDLLGYLRTVLFSPEDLRIVKGSPGERRRYLDLSMSQGSKTYGVTLQKYHHVLQQRNNLLKNVRKGLSQEQELAVWSEQLALYGSDLIRKRMEFLKDLVPQARKIHELLSNGSERLDITYTSSLGNMMGLEKSEIYEIFHSAIEEHLREEIERGVSLYGPHRDDLTFYINKLPLKIYGSQGQQRSAVLSLKIAEIESIRKNTGQYPILLLDDVMSELDDSRRTYLLELIFSKEIQTVFTGANSEAMQTDWTKHKVFYIQEGKIITEGIENKIKSS